MRYNNLTCTELSAKAFRVGQTSNTTIFKDLPVGGSLAAWPVSKNLLTASKYIDISTSFNNQGFQQPKIPI